MDKRIKRVVTSALSMMALIVAYFLYPLFDIFLPSFTQIIKESNNNENIHDDIPPVKFYILKEFKAETISYFNSCHFECRSQGRYCHNSNKASHLGAAYFTKERLQEHDWCNLSVTLNESEVVVVPFQFTKAFKGYCGESFDQNTANKEIVNAFKSIIELGEAIANKAILFILHCWIWCNSHFAQRNVQMRDLSNEIRLLFRNLWALDAHIYVALFENKWRCPWNIESTNNTIVIPYTMPITLNQYQQFNENKGNKQFAIWKQRSHSLFFMGSICQSNGFHYYDRLVAFKYLDKMKKNNVTNSFAVITDPDTNTNANDLCAKFGIYNMSKPCHVNDNVDGHYLCLLADKEMNKDNKLYIEGMRKSKFNLMIHGDTPTSGKFYDSLSFNLINIMVGITTQNKFKYLPFADAIPYEHFVFFIEPKEFEQNGYELLKNILFNTSDDVYKRMISNLTFYKKDILWNMKDSTVVKRVLREVVDKEK